MSDPNRWTLWQASRQQFEAHHNAIVDAVARVFSNSDTHAPWSGDWMRGVPTDETSIDWFVAQLYEYGHQCVLMSAPAMSDEPLEQRPICGFLIGGKITQREIDDKKWMAKRGIVAGMGSLRYVGVAPACRKVKILGQLEDVTSLTTPVQFDEFLHDDDERLDLKPRKISSLLYEAWTRATVGDCAELWMGTQADLVEMWEWGTRLGYKPASGPPLYKHHCGVTQRVVIFTAKNPFSRA